MNAVDLEFLAMTIILALLGGFLVAWGKSSIFGMFLVGPIVATLILTLCFYLLGRAGAAAALAAGITGVGKAVRG